MDKSEVRRRLRDMRESADILKASYEQVALTSREAGEFGVAFSALLLIEALEVYHKQVEAMMGRYTSRH